MGFSGRLQKKVSSLGAFSFTVMHSFIGTLIAFYLGTNTNFIEGSLGSKSDLDFEDYKDQFFYF